MAQRINRGVQKVAKQREQEDAQEFLTFLLDAIHQEQLKLRAMYGTEGESAAAPKKMKGGGGAGQGRGCYTFQRQRNEIIPGCPVLLPPIGFSHTFNKTKELLYGYYIA